MDAAELQVRNECLGLIIAARDKLQELWLGWQVKALAADAMSDPILYKADQTWNLASAEKIGFRGEVYSFTLNDMGRLGGALANAVQEVGGRQKHLWALFFSHHGEIVSSSKPYSEYAGHSLFDGRARYDEGVEVSYSLGSEKLTKGELAWLLSRADELSVPAGYYYDPILLKFQPQIFPQEDTLCIEYRVKTGSRRGIVSYEEGVGYSGSPSRINLQKCRGVLKWYLNGTEIYVADVARAEKVFCAWDHPNMRAMRALKMPSSTLLSDGLEMYPYLVENKEVPVGNPSWREVRKLVACAKALGKSYHR